MDVRKISIEEVFEAHRAGKLQDAFGAGTAATIAHIAEIDWQGDLITLPPVETRTVSNWLLEELNAIKTGLKPDPHHWIMDI
jgi:branched-chain amino acid aminotransferase